MAEGMNIIDGYIASDIDTGSANTGYYGYVGPTQCWYINQQSTSGNITTLRYFAGSGLANYQDAWTKRAGLAYDYYSNIFMNY